MNPDDNTIDPDKDNDETPEVVEPEASEPKVEIKGTTESSEEVVKKELTINKLIKVKLSPKESIKQVKPESKESKKETEKTEPKSEVTEEKHHEHKPCAERLETLAKPNIIGALENLERFRHVYPPKKYEAFKKRVQEMIAKTPKQIKAEFSIKPEKVALKNFKTALNIQKRKEFPQKIKDGRKTS